MSSTLFDRLKQKPVPLVKETVTVKVPARKKVEVKDKRGNKLVNREELLRKMREPRERKRQVPKPVARPDVPEPVSQPDVPEPVAPAETKKQRLKRRERS